MIDRILVLNKNEAVIVYSNKNPVKITSDEPVWLMLQWMFNNKITLTYSECATALKTMNEDTQILRIDQ